MGRQRGVVVEGDSSYCVVSRVPIVVVALMAAIGPVAVPRVDREGADRRCRGPGRGWDRLCLDLISHQFCSSHFTF